MSQLYDVFVDWPGRLGREMPGLLKHLRAVGARRVLDVGCGTGQHVAALQREGFDVEGADASEEMLAKADGVVEAGRLHLWRLGDAAPPSIEPPFDAVISLGNVWPQITEEGDVERALAAIRGLLRPGGLLLIGLKAFAARQAGSDPYLPLIRREHEGEPVFFIRFLEPGAGELADFHMVVASGENAHHRTGRVRIWSAETLRAFVAGRGYARVVVTAGIDGEAADAGTEDVFLRAFATRES